MIGEPMMVQVDIVAKNLPGCPGRFIGELIPRVSKHPSTLPCDGRAILVEDYPELFMVIGRTYSPKFFVAEEMKMDKPFLHIATKMRVNPEYDPNRFNVPDLRARVF